MREQKHVHMFVHWYAMVEEEVDKELHSSEALKTDCFIK